MTQGGHSGHVLMAQEWKVYPTRWYVIAVFSVMSCVQDLAWLLYSGAADATKEYYQTDQSWINLWLAMGPVAFIPSQFVVWWMIRRENGVRNVVYYGAANVMLGSIIRLLPQAFRVFHNKEAAMITITIAQIFNAIAGPAVMSTTTQLAALWFPDDFRVIATSIATQANGAGSLIGFIMIPYVAKWAGITAVVWVISAVSTVMFLAVLLHFPAKPPTPPSASTAMSPDYTGDFGEDSFRRVVQDLITVSTIPHLHVMVLVEGIAQGGLFSAWTGLFDPLFSSLYPSDVHNIFAGWMGFGITAVGILTATGAAVLTDKYCTKRRPYRLITVTSFAIACAGFAIAIFQFPSPFSSKPLFPHSHAVVALVFVVIGSGLGTPSPICQDWAAELSYPMNAGASCGLLCFWINVWAGVILLIQNDLLLKWLNTLMLILCICVAVVMGFIKQDFKRRQEEIKVAAGDGVVSEASMQIHHEQTEKSPLLTA
eukprot:TRINITY_DN67490_c15_g3_i1.p1 TRINITY_DN67490_c15_g3~~TRINITY_DN67490_c15_g3_i1.p1  ORF type:complete len:483 (+),score=25.62 TRINITY_DN67490_c15_g3_i1:66-1514(+)